MEFSEVIRTTFSAREFTDEPVPDEVLYRVFEQARFAPSGGNRQGWRVIVVRDTEARAALCELAIPASQRYAAQLRAGENPWNTVVATAVTPAEIAATPVPPMLTQTYAKVPVVLVVCVDLGVVASVDTVLSRVGVISGASIYPFAWSVLLGLRNEGYGGALTTMPIHEEPRLQALLGIPARFAVCAVMPIGRPVRQLTKLRRNPVSSFAVHERFDGAPLG
jgi:nitroreductase